MSSHNAPSGSARSSSPVQHHGQTVEEGPSRVAGAFDGPPRFHIFIIDAGWNSAPAKVLRENFHMIHAFQGCDPLFVLDGRQSIALLRNYPDLIAKDPILSVHDLQAAGGRGPAGYHGFRLCLGMLYQPAKALSALQEFLRFVAAHRHSPDIEQDVRRRLHRQGLEGAVEVVRESAELLART